MYTYMFMYTCANHSTQQNVLSSVLSSQRSEVFDAESMGICPAAKGFRVQSADLANQSKAKISSVQFWLSNAHVGKC